jgi:non-ribosomal peptide synthase protein (TIGR01720 family)
VAATGRLPATPILRDLFEQPGPYRQYQQSMLLRVPALEAAPLLHAIQTLLDHHDALRLSVSPTHELEIAEPGRIRADDCVLAVSLHGLDAAAREAEIAAQAQAAQERLDPQAGRLLQAVWFDHGEHSRLLLVVHHLAVDGVSWRILVPDLRAAYEQAAGGVDAIALEPVPTSFREWALALPEAAQRRSAELPFWRSMLEQASPDGFARPLDPRRDTHASLRSLSLSLDVATTQRLLIEAPERINGRVNDVLLTGFALAAFAWRRQRHGDGGLDTGSLRFDLEGHGRETAVVDGLIDGADLSRTVGWFTSLFPVRLQAAEFDPAEALAGGKALERALKSVKEQLRQVPDQGIGYGLLRHLHDEAGRELAAYAPPSLGFNYLGRFAVGGADDGAVWNVADEPGAFGGGSDAAQPLPHAIDLNALVQDGPDGPRLCANWSWAGALLDEAEVRAFAEAWFDALRRIADFAAAADAATLTPSDVPMVALDQSDIELLESIYAQLSD